MSTPSERSENLDNQRRWRTVYVPDPVLQTAGNSQ